MVSDEEFLEHFGKKGMKWGVKKSGDGVSRSTDRAAKKDAQEHARAKLFYGQGAGTRRKLIKATVESKKAQDPAYAKAFDKHLNSQDLGQHASAARKERKSTDRKDRTKKQAGAVARRFTGEMGTQAAFVAAAAGGVAYLSSPRGRQTMNTTASKVSKLVGNLNNERLRRQGAKHISDLFKNMGA